MNKTERNARPASLWRYIFFSLFAALAIFCQTSAQASEPANNRQVKAGIFNFDGYHMKDAYGNLSGYGIDLLRLLSQYSRLNFDFTGYDNSWQDMQKMLQNGEIDVVTSARRTPDREELFAFSLPVGRNYTILAANAFNDAIHSGDYSTYKDIIIGLVKGSSQNNELERFAKARGFNYTTREFDDPDDLSLALQTGEIDAILSSNLRKANNEKLLNIIKVDNFYAMARKEDKELIDEINYAIEQMNHDEGDWQNELFYRHYGPKPTTALYFTDREQHYIDSVRNGPKTIIATSREDVPPYSYLEDGKLKGILPDFFTKIMRLAGLPFILLPAKEAEEYLEQHPGNKIDVVLDRSDPLPVKESGVNGFTTAPYMTTGVAQVTKAGFDGEIKKAAVANNSLLKSMEGFLDNAEIAFYPTAAAAAQAVVDGEVDAAYILPYSAQIFVNNRATGDLVYTMMSNKGADFRMYVPENTDHELITILSKTIRALPDGTINQLGSRHTALKVNDMSVYHYLMANPGTLLIVAASIALAAFLIIFLIVRSRWNKKVLETTEQAKNKLEEQLSIVEALSRDYVNVFAINDRNGTFKPIKIEGYLPGGVDAESSRGQPYLPVLRNYIRTRVHPKDRKYLINALRLPNVCAKLAEQGEFTGSYRILEDDAVHFYQFTFVQLKNPENKNFILAGFRNIDEMIRREQEQKAILSEALAKARYASAAKTTFLNNMSHDIRTPMNAIIGFTSLAINHLENQTQVRDYLGKIMTSGNHLLSLINDVLDMSRIESGKVKIEEKENSLPDIIHDLKTIVQADVKAKQLNFQISTHNVVNEIIICDRLRLNQVLLNVLSNALKYTMPCGTVSLAVIQLPGSSPDNAVFQFRIKDTGLGMSAEFLEHVFEPFERESTSTISGIQGTGLGLAITKNIVDMMGGTITVESELGKGSEFIITFTFQVTSKELAQVNLPQLADFRALVVDDDTNTCTSVSKMLSTLGLRPDWTTLGREAIIRSNFAREQHDPYQIYILDWLMPDMNGIELTRRLRKIIGPEPRIIILTSYDWGDIEEEAHEAGVSGFCSKPVFLSRLAELLTGPRKESDGDDAGNEVDFSGKRILLAEDNEMNQEIAEMILEDAGFQLDIVDDGTKAVERIAAVPAHTYDLILMDVQMPIMNGYAATRKIRALADPQKASIPIVAMTANAFDEDRQEAMDAGMDGYVAKPIDIKLLLLELQRILESQPAHSMPVE